MSLGFGRPVLQLLDFKLLSNKRTNLLASRRLLPTTSTTPTVTTSVAVDETVPMGPWNLPPSCRWLTQEPGQRTRPERAFQSLRASKPVVETTPAATPAPVVFGPGHLPPSCRYVLQPPKQPSVCWRKASPSARCERAIGLLLPGQCPHSIKVSSKVQRLTDGVQLRSWLTAAHSSRR